MSDQYLWDRTGHPDPETARLEKALAPHAWKRWGKEPPECRGARSGRRRFSIWLAAGVLLTASLLLARYAFRSEVPRTTDYELQALVGVPLLDGVETMNSEALRPGQEIQCGPSTRARLQVGAIGSVVLEPGTRMRVEELHTELEGVGYLLYLDRGTVVATIFGEPREFQVGTPAGLAVDMGCIYTAKVDANGRTTLRVVSGLVFFEGEERRIVVPAGASAQTEPGQAPGTPVWDEAGPEWRSAVAVLDGRLAGDPKEALAHLLSYEDQDLTLPLWHFLENADPEVSQRAYEELARLVPPPLHVSREACLSGDRSALDTWRRTLSWSW